MNTHMEAVDHPAFGGGTPDPDRLDRRLGQLAAELDGRLIRAADPEWDRARAAWQLLADQHPAAVVIVADARDVTRTLRAAAELGLRVAPQATGHNAVPLGGLAGTVLLRTDKLTEVDIDPAARTARVEAGAIWGEVTAAAAAAGLAPVSGFSAGVGVVGFLLGAGLGWFARSHGLGRDSVLSLEAVTPDGVMHRTARGEELFEAVLSGAGVAVITAVTLQLHPIVSVTAGALFWPVESAREVFRAWADWTHDTPDSVTSTVRVLRFPDAPEVPPMFAGRAFAIVEAAVQEDPDRAAQLLEPLRRLAPQIDTFKVTEVPALAALHMDPPMPVRALGRSALLRTLPEAVLDDLAAALIGPAAVLTSVELRQLGGALDGPGGSATSGCRALLYAVAVAPPATLDAPPNAAAISAAQAAFAAVAAAVEPVRSTRSFAGFTEASGDPAELFGPELDRLRSAKLRWDPSDLIHVNHPVLPVSA